MASEELDLLLDLPAEALRSLTGSLESGPMSLGITRGTVEQYVGVKATQVTSILKRLSEEGCSSKVLAEVCRALLVSRERMESLRGDLYLVLGGPDISGVPVVDTATVARSLFAEAKTDVLLATYVIYSPPDFFEPLGQLMDAHHSLKVRIIVDLSPERKSTDEPLPIIENRFRKRFTEHCWPGTRVPELWYDPRPFKTEPKEGGVMHAKCLIVDNTAALITSANFTEAAHQRNIEAGILVRNSHEVPRLRRYFEGLLECGNLKQILA
jgi:hypothetical protein